jgi:hypothetical protein
VTFEQLCLHGALLQSSREVLEALPVAVAAIDTRGRMVYTYRLFAGAVGHLRGTTPGERCQGPWSVVAAAALRSQVRPNRSIFRSPAPTIR